MTANSPIRTVFGIFSMGLFIASASAQVELEWIQSYGNQDDSATAIAVDPTGNVYVTGSRQYLGWCTASDLNATIKYNSSGVLQWVKESGYPGSLNSCARTYAIAIDNAGVYVAAVGDLYVDTVIKYEPSSGDVVWVKDDTTLGKTNAIALDTAGNVYVTGSVFDQSYHEAYRTVKYDSNGNQLWSANYNGLGNDHDEATAIAVNNTGVYVTGISWGGDSTTGSDYATIKYDPATGNQVWVTHYSHCNPVCTQSGYEAPRGGIAVDSSGNVYVTGESGWDYATVKYDVAGNQLWAVRYNGPGNGYDMATAIAVDNTGVYVTGTSWGGSTGSDYATIKYDPVTGNQVWVARYNNDLANLDDEAKAMALDAAGNVYVTGVTRPNNSGVNYATVKYDSNGNQAWVTPYVGPNTEPFDTPHAIAVDAMGNVYVAGNQKAQESGDLDFVTIKYVQSQPPQNQPPTVGIITAPITPISMKTAIAFSAVFNDPNSQDNHTATWEWGDGSITAGTVTEQNGSGTVTGNHTYVTAGVYPVKLIVTDNLGGSGNSTHQFVVIYDPDGGFVTGGGWIESPAGAYTSHPELTGRANFGFVSKYKKGATVPTGTTDFQFNVANLNFHSNVYEWLVVAGAKAQYKGAGTINGAGNYGFILTAIDEVLTSSTDRDLFRIKIWNKDSGIPVYDNQQGIDDNADPTTAILGGSIIIHKAK